MMSVNHGYDYLHHDFGYNMDTGYETFDERRYVRLAAHLLLA